MATPQDPLSAEEYILRRVHRNHFDPDLPVPVQRAALTPTRADTTGLSVFREQDYRENPAGILDAVSEERRNEFYVVRIPVRALHDRGLRVVPEPTDLPGHCVVPELSRAAYESERSRLKDILLELAELGSQDIVHRPNE